MLDGVRSRGAPGAFGGIRTGNAPVGSFVHASWRPRLLLPVLVTATFVGLVHYLVFSPLLPLMAGDFGVSVSLLGQVPAGIGLGAGILGLVLGPLADQYGHRRALAAGLLGLVASSTLLVVAPTPLLLPVAALLGAVGRATVYPIALAVATTSFEGDARRRAISRITTSLSVAPIVGVPALTAIAGGLGWRAAFLAAAAVTAGLVIVVNAVLPAPANSNPRDGAVRGNFGNVYGDALGHGSTRGVIGATFLLSAGGWLIWTYLGTFLIQRFVFSTADVGWAWLVVGLGLLAGGLAGGSPLGKAPLRPLLALAAVGAGICLGGAFGLALTGWLAVGIIALGTLLHGVTQVASAVLLSQEARGGHAATMTLRGSAMSLGAALGSGLGGAILPIAGFGALGLIALCCCSGGALLAWPVFFGGERRTEPPSAPCGCPPCLAKAPV
jgi:MFS transporter, DHA1 family, inner membrane transport protein